MNRTITLQDFLTPEQITQVEQIYRAGGRAQEICDQVIQPHLLEIDRKLGQENHAEYLAYACEYVMSQLTPPNTVDRVDEQ